MRTQNSPSTICGYLIVSIKQLNAGGTFCVHARFSINCVRVFFCSSKWDQEHTLFFQQDAELCLSLSLALLYMKLASLCWLCCCCHHALNVFRQNANLIPRPEPQMGKALAHYRQVYRNLDYCIVITRTLLHNLLGLYYLFLGDLFYVFPPHRTIHILPIQLVPWEISEQAPDFLSH